MTILLEDVRHQRGGKLILSVDRLEIARGRATAVIGKNGAGKTTLLRLLAGLERPTRGRIQIDSLAARPAGAAGFAFAFQEPVFLRRTVAANLELGLELRGVPARERRERVHRAASECGIVHLLSRPAFRLSGGEAQRANLARALALTAPITLLDEPLSGLDHGSRAALLHELPQLLAAFTTTTILVTHEREEAFRLADDLVVLAGGQVLAAGPKRTVFASPPDPETAVLLGYVMLRAGLESVAINPESLRFGDPTALPAPGAPPELQFELTVTGLVDLCSHLEVQGQAGGTRLALRLPDSARMPDIGDRLPVAATQVVRFAAAALDAPRDT